MLVPLQLHSADVGAGAMASHLAQCTMTDDPSLKIKDDPRKTDGIDLHCFAGCGWRDVKAALKQRNLISDNGEWRKPLPTKPKAEKDADDCKRRVDFARSIWKQSAPLNDTLGEQYFIEHRKLDVRKLDLSHCIRWNDACSRSHRVNAAPNVGYAVWRSSNLPQHRRHQARTKNARPARHSKAHVR